MKKNAQIFSYFVLRKVDVSCLNMKIMNEIMNIFLKSFLGRSLWGPYVKGRYGNRLSEEPIRRGAFVKGPFVMEGRGGGVFSVV